MMGNTNTKLCKARKAKNDEFYTQLTDIEKELRHYTSFFKDKTIYCNCDDPLFSNFTKYFMMNFEELQLKKLISSCYKQRGKGYYKEHIGIEQPITYFRGNGDFRSEESIELLKEADVIVTNPPFSLMREYVAQLVEYDKKFLIISNVNAVDYKEVFPLIKDNKLWLGYNNNGEMSFQIPEDENGRRWKSLGNVCWFTNLDVKKRHEDIILIKKYDPKIYHKYDNYDAINVNRVADIPRDYPGAIGVPITFVGKYNPEQFEIIRKGKGDDGKDLIVNGKYPYSRIIIKNKKPEIEGEQGVGD